jgi:hypothetical protein
MEEEFKVTKEMEPFLRGFIGTLGCGLTGIVHGIVDCTPLNTQMSPLIHSLINYVPILSATTYSIYNEDFFESNFERTISALETTAIAGTAQLIGYYATRAIGEGIKKLI